MKKKIILIAKIFAFFVFFVTGCSSNKSINNSVDSSIVEEITPFQIGRLSPIVVRFTKDIKTKAEDAFLFSPKQKGELNFLDERTISFTPSEPYKSNSQVKILVNTKKLLEEGDNFSYTFLVNGPSYNVSLSGLELRENNFSLSGVLQTDIPLSRKEIDNIVSAEITGEDFSKKLSVDWSDESKTDKRAFTIKGIEKNETECTLSVKWNGKQLGISSKDDEHFAGEQTFFIPGADSFSVVSVDSSEAQKIVVSFSSELNHEQEISYLMDVKKRNSSSLSSVRHSVNKNVLTLFDDDNWQNISSIVISASIQNVNGDTLEKDYEIFMPSVWQVPSVQFSTDGNILPTTQGTNLAIETRNLTGISLRVFEIYNSNMLQFLQQNELDGSYDLSYVAEAVHSEHIKFEWNDSMQNIFVPRGIDLSNLVKKYPEGMFRIQLAFSKDDIQYACSESHKDFSHLPNPPDITDKNYSYDLQWEYLNKIDWTDRRDFWRYSKDPCHPAFYLEMYGENFKTRNVLVSDIGLIAKRTDDGDLHVAVTNLKTASPIKDVTVTLYSKINRQLLQAKSDSNGFAIFKNAKDARVVVATINNQASYLKLSEGAILSMSHFETGGQKLQQGAKGYIYGERGVWRPGDELFLTFVLQDLEKKFPKEIPLTFELQDPLGKIVDEQTLTNGVNGFYAIKTKTNADAKTGLYTAFVRFGGNEWSKNVRVESIVPNHLEVKLELAKKYLSAENNKLKLSGKWLHGSPTPNYKADVSMRLLSSKTEFSGYSSYTFDNYEYEVDSNRKTVWEGNLNDQSNTEINLELRKHDEVPGKLKCQFISRIFEPSGMFSQSQETFDFSPFKRYVGLRLPEGKSARKILYTDESNNVDVVLLTDDGKPVKDGKVIYSIYKLDWKWWWEKDSLTDATFVSSESKKIVESDSLEIKNGKGSFSFKIDRKNWGRYFIVVQDDGGKHAASKIVYIDWPDWAGRTTSGNAGSASVVPLTTDKEQYVVGEVASVSFATSEDSRALITIEKSGSIVKQEWLETKTGTTVYKLPLTEKMSPNVYVHVTLVQSHLQTKNSLPIRLYGVVPLLVENNATRLNPIVTTPASYEPGKKSMLTVAEKNGKPMTFTVAVVDEGLLNITNFKTPVLHDEFYKKESSLLENWDLFGYVMNAYSGKLETILSIGGSEEILDASGKTNSRFTPVVRYFGPYELKANAKKEIEFEMPEYIGSVRTMVVAGNNGAYGVAEKQTPVKSELMIIPTLPRVLGTNESVNIPVTVFNGTNNDKSVSVKFLASGSVNSSEEKNIFVKANSNAEAMFKINTSKNGNATFDISAKSSSASAKNTTTVEVKSKGMSVENRMVFAVSPGESYTASVQTPTDKNTARLLCELSPFQTMDLSARLDYLLRYPHGCIEQITSAAFPQLYLADFVELSKEQIEQTKNNVSSVIERYKNYQTSLGGMAYWQGGNEANVWGSCYAAHFLLSAKKVGYSVPDSLLQSLLSWIASSAKNWIKTDYDTSDIQAYKLFVLAEAAKAELGAMNRLRTEKMSDSAKLLLAASYAKSGRESIAKELFASVKNISTIGRQLGRSFASPLRDTAIMLYVSQIVGAADVSSRCAKIISDELSSGRWCSTQEISWSLLSLLPYYSRQKSGEASYEMNHQNGNVRGKIFKGSAIEHLVPTDTQMQTVVVKNTGSKILYGTLLCSGLSLPATEERESEGLSLDVVYYNSFGEKILPTAIKKGDTFRVVLSVKNMMNSVVENIALTFPIPTAWEITNERIGEGENVMRTAYTNQDIRDDVVYTYFDLKKGETFSHTFFVSAVHSGSYFVPAIFAQAMYDNDIRSVWPGVKIDN